MKKEEAGNTVKQPPQLVKWFFTFNNYTLNDIERLERYFNLVCKEYVFQEELGKNNTPHLQGNIYLKKAMRWSEFDLPKTIHWEKTKNYQSALLYCSKLDTRNGKIYTNIELPEPIECLNIEQLYEWQKEIYDYCQNKPHPREILFVCDKEGNKGKSELCRFLCIKNKAILLSGKTQDMKYGIIKYFEKNKKYPKIILIDLPRTYNTDYLCYTGIEEIKNGMFFNTKYESDMIIFNRPHIIIFANNKPDNFDNLSHDRWIIKEL